MSRQASTSSTSKCSLAAPSARGSPEKSGDQSSVLSGYRFVHTRIVPHISDPTRWYCGGTAAGVRYTSTPRTWIGLIALSRKSSPDSLVRVSPSSVPSTHTVMAHPDGRPGLEPCDRIELIDVCGIDDEELTSITIPGMPRNSCDSRCTRRREISSSVKKVPPFAFSRRSSKPLSAGDSAGRVCAESTAEVDCPDCALARRETTSVVTSRMRMVYHQRRRGERGPGERQEQDVPSAAPGGEDTSGGIFPR
jgi:hypothetical protein